MNSDNFIKVIKKAGAPAMMRKNNLKLLQDKATPHTSGPTTTYLKSEGVRTLFIPGSSPDFNPVENLFGRHKVFFFACSFSFGIKCLFLAG